MTTHRSRQRARSEDHFIATDQEANFSNSMASSMKSALDLLVGGCTGSNYIQEKEIIGEIKSKTKGGGILDHVPQASTSITAAAITSSSSTTRRSKTPPRRRSPARKGGAGGGTARMMYKFAHDNDDDESFDSEATERTSNTYKGSTTDDDADDNLSTATEKTSNTASGNNKVDLIHHFYDIPTQAFIGTNNDDDDFGTISDDEENDDGVNEGRFVLSTEEPTEQGVPPRPKMLSREQSTATEVISNTAAGAKRSNPVALESSSSLNSGLLFVRHDDDDVFEGCDNDDDQEGYVLSNEEEESIKLIVSSSTSSDHSSSLAKAELDLVLVPSPTSPQSPPPPQASSAVNSTIGTTESKEQFVADNDGQDNNEDGYAVDPVIDMLTTYSKEEYDGGDDDNDDDLKRRPQPDEGDCTVKHKDGASSAAAEIATSTGDNKEQILQEAVPEYEIEKATANHEEFDDDEEEGDDETSDADKIEMSLDDENQKAVDHFSSPPLTKNQGSTDAFDAEKTPELDRNDDKVAREDTISAESQRGVSLPVFDDLDLHELDLLVASCSRDDDDDDDASNEAAANQQYLDDARLLQESQRLIREGVKLLKNSEALVPLNKTKDVEEGTSKTHNDDDHSEGKDESRNQSSESFDFEARFTQDDDASEQSEPTTYSGQYDVQLCDDKAEFQTNVCDDVMPESLDLSHISSEVAGMPLLGGKLQEEDIIYGDNLDDSSYFSIEDEPKALLFRHDAVEEIDDEAERAEGGHYGQMGVYDLRGIVEDLPQESSDHSSTQQPNPTESECSFNERAVVDVDVVKELPRDESKEGALQQNIRTYQGLQDDYESLESTESDIQVDLNAWDVHNFGELRTFEDLEENLEQFEVPGPDASDGSKTRNNDIKESSNCLDKSDHVEGKEEEELYNWLAVTEERASDSLSDSSRERDVSAVLSSHSQGSFFVPPGYPSEEDSAPGEGVEESKEVIPEQEEAFQETVGSTSSIPLPYSYLNYTDPSKLESYFVLRLENAIENAESNLELRRSSDLVPLTKQYQDFRRRLQTLVKSTKDYKKAARQLEIMRSKCFEDCSNLFDNNSHHHDSRLGGFPKLRTTTTENSNIGPIPLVALHQFSTNVEESKPASEFQQWVLDYVTKWEKDVTSKIDTELRQVKKLQQSRLHYERKVDSLRQKIIGMETKGKETPPSLAEKVNRNEKKLQDAWKSHEQRASQLCALIEQVTEHGWMDLYPLVENLLKWEYNRSGRENMIFGQYL